VKPSVLKSFLSGHVSVFLFVCFFKYQASFAIAIRYNLPLI